MIFVISSIWARRGSSLADDAQHLVVDVAVGGNDELAGETVETVTSGGYCPSLGRGMGMGLVPPTHKAVGTALAVAGRGSELRAEVVDRPFYTEGSVRKG